MAIALIGVLASNDTGPSAALCCAFHRMFLVQSDACVHELVWTALRLLLKVMNCLFVLLPQVALA